MTKILDDIQLKNAAAFDDVFEHVRKLTMVPQQQLFATWAFAIRLIEENVKGDFAEFGVWRGGCSFGLALIQRAVFGSVVRPVWMFDSFQGLPAVDVRDGLAAAAYQRDTESPRYFDNCRASYQEAVDHRAVFNLAEIDARLIQGWFHDTVPQHVLNLQANGLALMRVDCDWYAPVRFVLDQLDPLVNTGGVVILDDYYKWDGCSRATHDFMSRRAHAYRLRELGEELAAYYIKSDGAQSA